MARPEKGGEAKRTFMIYVRMTAAEKIKLQALAQSAGLTPSDFIRVRTVDAPPLIRKATPEREAFIGGLGQLRKIGVNLNQMTRALNRRHEDGEIIGVSKELIEAAIAEVKTLTSYLISLLK